MEQEEDNTGVRPLYAEKKQKSTVTSPIRICHVSMARLPVRQLSVGIRSQKAFSVSVYIYMYIYWVT